MLSTFKNAALKLLTTVAASACLSQLATNDYMTGVFVALDSHFNDFLMVNLPAPKRSEQVIPLGISQTDAPQFFATKDYSELKKIIAGVMDHKPLFAISTFRPYAENVSDQVLKDFVTFTKAFPNLYFYSYFEPSDVEGLQRHPILKELNSIFIPLTSDRTLPPYDQRVRRLVVDFAADDSNIDQPLLALLRDYGIARSAADFKTWTFYTATLTFLRYRGATAYSSTKFEPFRHNSEEGTGKIIVFGPGDVTIEDSLYRASSIYSEKRLTAMERISMALDTFILKDPVARATPAIRAALAFGLIFLYLVGLLFLNPVRAAFWGFGSLAIWLVTATAAFTIFNQFIFLTEVAVTIGAVHFFTSPALLIRHLRAQDRKVAARERQIELQNLRSSLVVKSARADMGLRIATQVAHDIRSPLGAITIATQMRDKGNSTEVTQLLTQSVDRLQRISDDLLKRFRTGEFFDQSSSELNLLRFFNQLADEYRAAWPQVALSIAADEHAAILIKDQSALERAFSNLLNNSVEASPEFGRKRGASILPTGRPL